MHRWSDDITNELKLRLKHRLSNRLWAGSKPNPPKSERSVLLKRQQSVLEERATDQWQQPMIDLSLSSQAGVLESLRRLWWIYTIKNNLDTFPPSPGEMLLKETQKQKWKSFQEKQNLFRIKDIFGFSFKESSTAKPRRLKVTQKTENTQLLSRKSNTTE